MRLFLAMFITYLIGSIPTGYLIAKFTKRIDLRRQGSGNIGATNVLRVIGKLAALSTLIIDILKGFIAVTFWADMAYSFRMNITYTQYLAVLGACVVIGHSYSLFLDFKGGKGVATSAGVMLALCPRLLLIGLCVWALAFISSKIVSVSSLSAAVAIPVASYFFDYPRAIRLLVAVLAVLIIVRHKENIKRLAKKEEHRWSVRI